MLNLELFGQLIIKRTILKSLILYNWKNIILTHDSFHLLCSIIFYGAGISVIVEMFYTI